MTGSELTKTQRTMTCLECKMTFIVGRKPAHHCPACRKDQWNDYQADRRRQIKEGVWPALHARLPEEISIEVSGMIDDFLRNERVLPTVMDRQPTGYMSPAGSDEGRSTFFKDLAADLDYACKQVAKDTWWVENPHWAYQLDNPHAVKKIKGE